MSLVYLYDGSFDGLLTAVFEAYARRERPDCVAEEGGLQVSFGQEVVPIGTDEAKARRVETAIRAKIAPEAHEKIWKAFLSSDIDKGTAVYRYVRRGLQAGRMVLQDLAHPDVLDMDRICRLVGREQHLLTEFLRFSQMENGVFYAKVTPEHCVVPMMMPHFVDRYCVQPFLIHDMTHGLCGVYDMKSWYMVEAREITLPDEAWDELRFKRMWKRFYETIAIKERFNPRCRRNHMPKKYWRNMTEHNFVETPKTRAMDARQGGMAQRYSESTLE